MKYFFSLLTMVCVCVATVDAAPGDNNSNRSRGERFRNGGGRRGGNFFERIKKQYPKEAAEIEKLRESNPEQARTKMRELMRKAGSVRCGSMSR